MDNPSLPRDPIVESGVVAATLGNIAASVTPFRMGIGAELGPA